MIRSKGITFFLDKMLFWYKLAEETTFVPMDSEFVQPNGRIINEYFSDGLHPNKDGYIRMAKMLEKYVNE